MIRSGLIYGVITGPIGLMGAMFILRFFAMAGPNLIAVLISGVILGGVIGLWLGLTCGDDIAGAKVGALLGAVAQGGAQILHPSKLGMTGVIISAVLGAALGALAGYFIGMMVENSIGE
jgi:membrane protein YqaA with SNARE-associated domain